MSAVNSFVSRFAVLAGARGVQPVFRKFQLIFAFSAILVASGTAKADVTTTTSINVTGGGTLTFTEDIRYSGFSSCTSTSFSSFAYSAYTITNPNAQATSVTGWSNVALCVDETTPVVLNLSNGSSITFSPSPTASGVPFAVLTQYTGYVDPKFIVVGVTYAPPGASANSFVQYQDSTFVGTTQSISNSITSSHTESLTLAYGLGIPKAEGGQISDDTTSTNSQTTKNTSTVTTSIQIQTGEKTFGTGNYFAPVDNDYDLIWVWLNPVAIFTVTGNDVQWNGYGFDATDQPGMDIIPIALGYLNGHFGSMPPDIQTSIDRAWAAGQIWPAGQSPALTSADLAQIASFDPFSVSSYGPNYIGYAPPAPETSDHRFTMSQCSGSESMSYLQADPSGTPNIVTCTLTYTNTSTAAQDITTSYTQTFSIDASLSGTVWYETFSADLKNSNTLTWTTEAQSSITNTNSSTASLSVQGPPCTGDPCSPAYDASFNQPAQYYVYQDNMFGTFMFAPVHYY